MMISRRMYMCECERCVCPCVFVYTTYNDKKTYLLKYPPTFSFFVTSLTKTHTHNLGRLILGLYVIDSSKNNNNDNNDNDNNCNI